MEISSVSYELSKEVEECNHYKYLGFDQYLIENNKKLKKKNEETLMRSNCKILNSELNVNILIKVILSKFRSIFQENLPLPVSSGDNNLTSFSLIPREYPFLRLCCHGYYCEYVQIFDRVRF